MADLEKDPAVLAGRLENGLTYLVRHNETPKGMACFYLVKRVGSVMEEDDESGFAHFLEHMSFNGMEGFPGKTAVGRLESVGVRFGEELNAYTNAEETVYVMNNVPVSDANADLCLRIMSGWISGLHLSDEAVESERGIVLDEFRVTANPMQRMFDRMQPDIYRGSRYGLRPVLGKEETIAGFAPEKLRAFCRKWSRPDLSAVIAVGDFDPAAMVRRIRRMELPLMTGLPARPVFDVPDNVEPVVLSEEDPEQEFPRMTVWMKYDMPSPGEANSEKCLREDYTMELVMRMLQSRLQYMANGNTPPFMDASVSLSEFLLSETKRMMEVSVDMEDPATGMKAVFTELKRAARLGFSVKELERAKRGWMNSMQSNYNDRAKRKNDSFCREYMRHFTRMEPIPSIEYEYGFACRTLPDISLEEANEAAASVLGGLNTVIACFMPECSGISGNGVREILDDVRSEEPVPYEDRSPDGPLVRNPGPRGYVVSASEGMYGYTRYELSNGASVYVKETDFSDDEILFTCFRKKGRKNFPKELFRELYAAEQLVTIGGLGGYSRQDLYSLVEERQFELSVHLNPLMTSVKGNCSCSDLETMLSMLYLQFTSVARDDEAFAVWKTRTESMLSSALSNHMEQTYRLSDQLLFGRSDAYVAPLPEDVSRTDYGKALEIARELFSDASAFTFIFTGQVTGQRIVPMLEKYIASLPSTGSSDIPEVHELLPGPSSETVRKRLETPASYSVTLWADSMEPDLRTVILAEMSGQILDMELMADIREEDGDVYAVSGFGYAGSFRPSPVYLYASFQCPVGRETAIHAKTDAAVGRMSLYGPDAERMEKCREYMRKKHSNDSRTNAYFQKTLVSSLISGYDLMSGYEDALESLTADDVREFVSSVAKPSNMRRAVTTAE